MGELLVLPREVKHYFEPECHLPKDKIKFVCSPLTIHYIFLKDQKKCFSIIGIFLLRSVIPLLIKIKAFWCDCIIQMHLSGICIDSKY